jgi:hypothetical protein
MTPKPPGYYPGTAMGHDWDRAWLAGYRAAEASARPSDDLTACEERERDLRDALLEASYYHVKHDGTPRHPKTCNDCRRLAEREQIAARLEPGEGERRVTRLPSQMSAEALDAGADSEEVR